MDQIIDILFSALFLSVVVGTRFNKWPAEQSKLFTGSPSDYIDGPRFKGYCLIYILTFFVLTLIVRNSPQLLDILKVVLDTQATQVPQSNGIATHSYLIISIAVFIISTLPMVSPYDEQWRKKLHVWARIPQSVKEITRGIIRSNAFMPTPRILSELKREITRSEQQSRFALSIENLDQEKAARSIDWYYIQCASLLLIVKELCLDLTVNDLKTKGIRIEELGRIITSPSFNENEFNKYKHELEELSLYFVECICKHVIKKYPRKDAQYTAFKNLGFVISQHDSSEIRIKDAISLCFIGVILISISSVAALLLILDFYQPERQYLDVAKFVSWTTGSIISFSIAIFVGIVIKKMPSADVKVGMFTYFIALLFATLASFVFFVIVRDLALSLEKLPIARICLAMSFSTLSIVVIKALNNASYDRKEVVVSSLFYGIVLGVVMAVFQVLISIAFSWNRIPESVSVLTHYFSDWKLFFLFSVGFLKGLFVGGGISYFIQKTQREQLLAALRKNPRVNRVLVMELKSGEKAFYINTKDISTNGIKIQTRETLHSGDQIELSSPIIGSIKGVIKWTQSQLLGKQIAGIEFTKSTHTLQKYIRDNYGEYYAG
ncbi:PilZ domain-containing protein [Alkalimarinus alittae]|uniref:PilZ domain-containing protein n=1 Tax=Alkalimarinus alittae TaxID=2961619 RepID=A0ABY6MXJ1_9ALTE|nr:PilZ domain-containing protein [Alkalimarinus alittae]UZE94541.1 PilZ domain-containing protein [Alkalimarinus alittae]